MAGHGDRRQRRHGLESALQVAKGEIPPRRAGLAKKAYIFRRFKGTLSLLERCKATETPTLSLFRSATAAAQRELHLLLILADATAGTGHIGDAPAASRHGAMVFTRRRPQALVRLALQVLSDHPLEEDAGHVSHGQAAPQVAHLQVLRAQRVFPQLPQSQSFEDTY